MPIDVWRGNSNASHASASFAILLFMKLTLNKDYARRHLFVAVLMLGLGCWFGYDGLVAYPSMTAAELYRSIEKADPPTDMPSERLEAFKKQKTQTQYGFAVLALLAGGIVGLRLLKSAKFAFAFDDAGFTTCGKRYTRDDIASVDRTRWESKTILVLKMKDGSSIVLDAWHHTGVKDFAATL